MCRTKRKREPPHRAPVFHSGIKSHADPRVGCRCRSTSDRAQHPRMLRPRFYAALKRTTPPTISCELFPITRDTPLLSVALVSVASGATVSPPPLVPQALLLLAGGGPQCPLTFDISKLEMNNKNKIERSASTRNEGDRFPVFRREICERGGDEKG